MIHFPHYHHLSVLVRLLRLVEADCMQIQITFLAKSSRRLFFPPAILRTPISSLPTAV